MPQTACVRAVDGENAGQRALGHLDVHTHRGSDSVPAAAGASSFSSTASPRGGSTFSSSPDMVLSVLSNYDWILSRSMRSQLSPTLHTLHCCTRKRISRIHQLSRTKQLNVGRADDGVLVMRAVRSAGVGRFYIIRQGLHNTCFCTCQVIPVPVLVLYSQH